MDHLEPIVLSSINVEIDRETVLDRPPFSRWLESPSGPAVKESVDRLREVVLKSVDPRACYVFSPIEQTDIEHADPPQGLLAGSHVGLGVLTLGGSRPDEDLSSKIDPIVWDALENVALQEARTRLLEAVLEAAETERFNTTRVYAPGTRLEGWALEGRQFVFDSLPLEEIDVTIKNGRPDPEKTLTVGIGLGPEIEQAAVLLSCGECGKIDTCPYAGGKAMS